MNRLPASLGLLAFVWAGCAFAGESPDQFSDIETETHRLQKELQQIESQRQTNRQDMETDNRDFSEYRARTDKRLASMRSDIDSLKRETVRNQSGSDSLGALIQSAQEEKREIELSRDRLRNRILASCDKLDAQALRLSPQSLGRIRSSLALVKSDLAAKTIECAEGFARLAQIVGLMRDAMASIQTSSETSPVPDIRGLVVRLRVGCVMDAVADSKGTVCYVWTGNNNGGEPVWKPATDKIAASEIVHAVAVREGKALPAFVDLPLAEVKEGVLK
jgi:Protein of unknown function (DUF3450)